MRKSLSVLVSGLLLLAGTANAQAQKEWTVLVFLNGNNNLDQFGTTNINQLEKAGGSNSHVNWVVEWASEANPSDVTRLLAVAGPGAGTVTSPVVQHLGKVDMGDYNNLIDFVKWGVQNYPAQHYIVDVWDHGSGWHALTMKSMNLAQAMIGVPGSIFQPNDISWDELSGNHITTKQLGQALAASAQIIGHKVDIYGSDACMMGSVEVAAEMKDSVAYFVGSEEVEAGLGWPYDSYVTAWGDQSRTPKEVATIFAQEYVKSYEGGSNGTDRATMGAYDLSQLPALETAVAQLATSISGLHGTDLQALQTAASGTQAFTDDDYKDILDFVTKAEAAVPGIDRSATSAVAAAAQKMIISAAATSDFPGSHGMTIWLPNSMSEYQSYSDGYAQMQFSSTGWGNALQAMLAGTR